MRLFAVLLVSLSVVFSLAAGAQTAPSELRQFLFNMGLEDYVAMTKAAQDKGLQYNEMNRRQQNRNMKTYSTVNASRELAILIYSELEPRLQDTKTRADLVEFAAKMLALKPVPPRMDYPASVMKRPKGEERTAAVNEWLDQQRRIQMEDHSRQIVADIASLLYGDQIPNHGTEVARFYDLVTTIVDRMYMDTLVGETRYLGRGLAALMARHEKLAGHRDLTKALSKELAVKYEGHLENFLGDQWIIDTSSGEKSIKVENGTMLLTRNLSADSLQIAVGALASIPESRRIGRKLGLIGQLRASPFFVSPEDAADGLSVRERLHDKIQQMNLPLSAGFSHVGFVMVKEDAQTGLKMTYTIDNYPQMAADQSGILANPGGMRITGLEQMLDSSHHSKIAIGVIDHAKFHAWSQEAAQVVGYPKDGVIYDSQAIQLKDAEPVLPEHPQSDPWRIQISKDEYDRLHRIQDPDQWYKAASDNFIKKGLLDLFERGTYFQWVTAGAYFKGGAYCSQSGFLAWLQSNGDFIERAYSPGKAEQFKAHLEEMQKTVPGFKPADGWSWHVRFLARLGHLAEKMKEQKVLGGIAKKILANGVVQQSMLFAGMDIVAPSGLLSQDHVNTKVFDLKDHRLEDRMKTPYREYRVGQEAEGRRGSASFAMEAIERALPRTEKRFQRHAHAHMDPSDVAGAAMRDIEYRMAVYGAEGKKTIGVTPDDVAEIGSRESMERIREDWIKRGRPDAVRGPQCEGVFAK